MKFCGCYSRFSTFKMAAAVILLLWKSTIASFSNRAWQYITSWRSIRFCSHCSRLSIFKMAVDAILDFWKSHILHYFLIKQVTLHALTMVKLHEDRWNCAVVEANFLYPRWRLPSSFPENLNCCCIFESSMYICTYWYKFMNIGKILQLLQPFSEVSTWRPPPFWIFKRI